MEILGCTLESMIQEITKGCLVVMSESPVPFPGCRKIRSLVLERKDEKVKLSLPTSGRKYSLHLGHWYQIKGDQLINKAGGILPVLGVMPPTEDILADLDKYERLVEGAQLGEGAFDPTACSPAFFSIISDTRLKGVMPKARAMAIALKDMPIDEQTSNIAAALIATQMGANQEATFPHTNEDYFIILVIGDDQYPDELPPDFLS